MKRYLYQCTEVLLCGRSSSSSSARLLARGMCCEGLFVLYRHNTMHQSNLLTLNCFVFPRTQLGPVFHVFSHQGWSRRSAILFDSGDGFARPKRPGKRTLEPGALPEVLCVHLCSCSFSYIHNAHNTKQNPN